MDSVLHFESSKSGDKTCCFQGKYLHSKYNPKSEGERFAASLTADFSPLCVFIIEPALSYCAPFLKTRFPHALICAIRFSHSFSESDEVWDSIFYLDGTAANPLSERLFTALGEEKLISSLAFDWTPTKQAFPEQSLAVWSEIRAAILKARDVMGTRSYFARRWLKNAIIFAARVQNAVLPAQGNMPVIIAASGPTLKSSLPFLKSHRERFFLIAVSSAFLPLAKNEITPDLVLSSDGGYWAKKHLAVAEQADTVFALEAEGAAPKALFAQKRILPLCYEDGLETDLIRAIGCPYALSQRNGTVAGTALTFALSLTNGAVYLCGFDQAPASAFQHTQPNALETDGAKKDFRLKTTETRQSAARFNSAAALSVYRNWFVAHSQEFSARVFRLSDKYAYQFGLGHIREVNWTDFERRECSGTPLKKPALVGAQIGTARQERGTLLRETLDSLSRTPRFFEEVFPLDSLLIKREISQEKRRSLEAARAEKARAFLHDCEKLL